jgi:uncharacterized protein YceK
MKEIIALSCIAVLAGCGTVARSSGPLQVGPDTYRIMARASVGNQVDSQKMAFSEANSHCTSLARKMVTTNTRSTQYDGYEVTFRCLKDGDPDLVRPMLQKAPDTVIQVK